VALKTRRHGLVSPWLAKRQREKKGRQLAALPEYVPGMQTGGSLAPTSPFSEIHFVNQRGARKGTRGSAQRVVEEVKVQGAFSKWGGG